MAELAREHRRPAARVDDPPCADGSCVERHAGCISLELDAGHFRGALQIASSFDRDIEHVLIERAAVDLERRQPRLVFRAELDAIVKGLVRLVREPHSQSLFGQMMMYELI